MLRPLLRTTAAIAFAALLAPATPEAASPPGLQYDEIVRVVVSGTPAPPGAFQADLAAAQSAAPVAAATPAPRRRGIGLGNIASIAGGILTGNPNAVAGAVANEAVSQAAEAQLERATAGMAAGLSASIANFLKPHVLRYAYWNNWERIDDLTAQSATIRKCDLGEVLRLDLAHKTYARLTPQAEAAAPSAPPAPSRPAAAPRPARAQEPGTGVATLSATTRNLGAQQIEGQPTTGYSTTTSFAMTQATGSCRNGSASFESVEYLTNIARPTVQCPIRPSPPVPETPVQAVAPPSGGCRPTFNANASGPTPPQNRLSLYTLVRISGGQGGNQNGAANGVGFLTERGNLKTLGQNDAALFEIPAGFTQGS